MAEQRPRVTFREPVEEEAAGDVTAIELTRPTGPRKVTVTDNFETIPIDTMTDATDHDITDFQQPDTYNAADETDEIDTYEQNPNPEPSRMQPGD